MNEREKRRCYERPRHGVIISQRPVAAGEGAMGAEGAQEASGFRAQNNPRACLLLLFLYRLWPFQTSSKHPIYFLFSTLAASHDVPLALLPVCRVEKCRPSAPDANSSPDLLNAIFFLQNSPELACAIVTFNHYSSYCVNCYYSICPFIFHFCFLGRIRFFLSSRCFAGCRRSVFWSPFVDTTENTVNWHPAVVVCNHDSKQWSFGEAKRFVLTVRLLNCPISLTDKLAQAPTPRSPRMSTKTTEEVYRPMSESVVRCLLYFLQVFSKSQ